MIHSEKKTTTTCHWVNVDEQRSVIVHQRGSSTSKTFRPTKCHAWNFVEVIFYPFLTFSWKKSTFFVFTTVSEVFVFHRTMICWTKSHQVVTSLEESLHSTIHPSFFQWDVTSTLQKKICETTPLSNSQTENTKYLEVKICRINQGTQGPPINRLAMSLKSWMAVKMFAFGERLGFWCLPFIGGWLYTVDFCWV